MEKYLWLFPILFIFHDMEEIIGYGTWLRNNKELLCNRFPCLSKMKIYNVYTTEGMALAVFEEFILCIIFCVTSMLSNWYALWLGTFIAYTIHLVIHIVQSIIIRKYIPALATSIIALPLSVYFISESIALLEYTVSYVILFSIIGIAVVAINLKFAHILMCKYTEWITR